MEISRMIEYVQDIIYDIHIQNYHNGCMLFRKLMSEMQESDAIMHDLNNREGILFPIVSCLLQTLESDDLILLADILEEEMLPALKLFVVSEEIITKADYCIETTTSGHRTVRDLRTGIYLHSCVNPMEEAADLVKLCYDPKAERYAVWGLGLGYHVARLLEESRESVKIYVFEPCEDMIALEAEYGILKSVDTSKIEITVDSTGSEFARCISQGNTGILMHFPSVKKIQDDRLRELINRFFADWNGTIQYKNELLVNFRMNRRNCSSNVDELKEVFQGKKVVIVGGGPSLDERIETIRSKEPDMLVIAVTTVLKKLINQSIFPDFAVVMDSQLRTFGQIEGLMNVNTPLLVDSTACWKFAEEHCGKRYIVYQKGFDEADRCAKEEGCQQYETGGSVVTLALQIALQLGVSEVCFLGVDLAYPDGVSHATGTMDRKKRDTEGMKRVKSVSGEWVYTDLLFESYRIWIEKKIKEHPHVKFYNLSTCGAHIEGCVMKK